MAVITVSEGTAGVASPSVSSGDRTSMPTARPSTALMGTIATLSTGAATVCTESGVKELLSNGFISPAVLKSNRRRILEAPAHLPRSTRA